MRFKAVGMVALVLLMSSITSCSAKPAILDANSNQITQINSKYFSLKMLGMNKMSFQCRSLFFDKIITEIKEPAIKKALQSVYFNMSWSNDQPMKIEMMGVPDISDIDNKEGFYKTLNGVRGMITSALQGSSLLFQDLIMESEGVSIKNTANGQQAKWLIEDTKNKIKTELLFGKDNIVLSSDLYVNNQLSSKAELSFLTKNNLHYLDEINFTSPSEPSRLGYLKVRYKKFNDMDIPSEIYVQYTQNGVITAEDTIVLTIIPT